MIQMNYTNFDRDIFASYEVYHKIQDETEARTYDTFLANGHEWSWCLVGNVVKEREYGENHEIRNGVKQLSGGTKVFVAPVQWGDGGEDVVVIGMHRYGKRYIEIIIPSRHIENYRMQKVYKPAVLKLMCASRYEWWGDTLRDRERIINYLNYRAPEEAAKERDLLSKEYNTPRPDKALLVEYEKILWERYQDFKMLKGSISSFHKNEEVEEMLKYVRENPDATKLEVQEQEWLITGNLANNMK